MIEIFAYQHQQAQFVTRLSPEELPPLVNDPNWWIWVDLTHPAEEEIAFVQHHFYLDAYALEDCTHPRQLPKLETFSDYHFFIVQMVRPPNHQEELLVDLYGFLSQSFLITYHHEPIQAITEAKQRFVHHKSHIIKGTPYLAYEILDPFIDDYLPILEYFDERLLVIEQSAFNQFSAETYVKTSKQIVQLYRTALKNQHVFYQFSHSTLCGIDEGHARLFRDIYDHMVRVVDMSEHYQSTLRGALEVNVSLSSHRMNQVVQLLTLFATIALPLNVLTGIYGMNFDWMPFLHTNYGFSIVVSLMVLMIVGMLTYFKCHRWI